MMEWSHETGSLDLTTLRRLYGEGRVRPSDVISAIYDRIERRGDDHAWIHLVSREDAIRAARRTEESLHPSAPLFGVPYAIKDNFDVPGLPTTCACPATSYVAERTGMVVERVMSSGAILIGKTNMDQFAIGLVGARSPYGACASVFDDYYISGGSSSGSALAVAAGLVSFSLANDAAGSGRVPAAFNNIVGLKPTPGLISNSSVSRGGNVKTIETISVLALTCDDALHVTRLIAGYDPDFAFSLPEADGVDLTMPARPAAFRFGVPDEGHLRFFGDDDARRLFEDAQARIRALGGERVVIDFAPFEEVQRILYDGPWIAERALGFRDILREHRDQIFPVTRQILESAKFYSAEDAFSAIHQIAELKCATRPVWQEIDVLVVPTTPTIYTIAEVEAEPIRLNSQLGIYTNFVNLMGLCGTAVPNGFNSKGLPQGITILAPPFQDAGVTSIGKAYHESLDLKLGGTLQQHREILNPVDKNRSR